MVDPVTNQSFNAQPTETQNSEEKPVFDADTTQRIALLKTLDASNELEEMLKSGDKSAAAQPKRRKSIPEQLIELMQQFTDNSIASTHRIGEACRGLDQQIKDNQDVRIRESGKQGNTSLAACLALGGGLLINSEFTQKMQPVVTMGARVVEAPSTARGDIATQKASQESSEKDQKTQQESSIKQAVTKAVEIADQQQQRHHESKREVQNAFTQTT